MRWTYLKPGVIEGRYNLEVSAEKHGTYHSTIEIVAGQVKEISAFLSRQMVTYNWTVEPVQIEDQYRITLEAEFETNVPAPVVTVEPALQVVPFPEGETATVNVTVTNHGLIAAHNVGIEFDQSANYEVVPLIREIGILPPMSSVVVPVNPSVA